MSGSLRLRLRGPLRQADETFKILAPRWLSEGETAEGPRIRTLFDDDFVNTFFAGVRASVSDGQPAWVPTAWPQLRVWRDYAEPPSAMLGASGTPRYPDSVARRTSLKGETDLTVKEAEGASTSAPWLRKLYLPLHQHFHFVCCEIVCDQREYPYVDASRIESVRAVVRRLRPGAKEVWEDWIPGAGGRGAWVVLTQKIEDVADPEALAESLVPLSKSLKRGLGIADGGLRLDSIPLAVLPQELGLAAKRQGRYGYLPVWSREKVTPLAQGAPSAKQIFDAGIDDETLKRFRGDVASAVRKLGFVAFDIPAQVPSGNQLPDVAFLTELQKAAHAATAGVSGWFDAVCKAQNVDPELYRGRMELLLSEDFAVDENYTRLVSGLLICVMSCRKAVLDSWKGQLRALMPEHTPQAWSPSKDSTLYALGEQIEAIRAWENTRKNPGAPWGPPPWNELPKANKHALNVHEAALQLEVVCLRLVEAMAREFGSAWQEAGEALAEDIDVDHLGGLPMAGDLIKGLFVAKDSVTRALFCAPGYATTLANFRARLQPLIQENLDALAAASPSAVTSLRYDADSIYAVWVYARITHADPCVQPSHVWSRRSEPFQIADPTDLLGQRPVAFSMPDLKKLKRDIPRMFKAGVMPFAAVTTPKDSGFTSPDDPKAVKPKLTIGMICSFGIPIFTICAMILFSIILALLLLIPGFAWLLTLKFCVPVVKKA